MVVGRWPWCGVALIIFLAMSGAHAQEDDDLVAIRAQVSRLDGEGKHAEAISLAERHVASVGQKHGEAHPEFAAAVSWLAGIYGDQGRDAEAGSFYKRSLDIREKVLGPDHMDVGFSLWGLAIAYSAQWRHAEAEPLFKRALRILERVLGPDSPGVGGLLAGLAEACREQGRHAEAEPLYQRALAIREKALGPDHQDVATLLADLATTYWRQGRRAEAEPLYRRALAIREKALGPDHLDVATSLADLAATYWRQGRRAEAEPLYRRALAIREKGLGPDDLDVATTLADLAGVYLDQNRHAEAEPLYWRALAIREKELGPDHLDVARALNDLAGTYWNLSRYAEAEPFYRRALAIQEKQLGDDHLDVATTLSDLAGVYWSQGRYAEAERLDAKVLAIREKRLGADHVDVGKSLRQLATSYERQGRNTEARRLRTKALAVHDRALGPDHPDVAASLGDLAETYADQGRYAEAEALHMRALAMAEQALGRDHPDVASLLAQLAGVYADQGRHAEAEPLYQRALTIVEKKVGPDHPDVGEALGNLASLYVKQNRRARAELLYRRALAIAEKALGPDHPDVALVLRDLASLRVDQTHDAEAERLYKRALAIREKALGPDHPDVAESFGDLAELAMLQSKWDQAAKLWRRSTGIVQRRLARGASNGSGKEQMEEAQSAFHDFVGLVKAGHRLAPEGHKSRRLIATEMFEVVQWAQASAAAGSLAQMAARGIRGADAALVRERQDLVVEWEKRDGERTAALSRPSDQRDRAAEATNADRLAAIDAHIAAIDQQFKGKSPDYAALAYPTPSPVADVQANLQAGEALVLILGTDEFDSTPEETFLWVVTKTDLRWVRSELGAEALKREVAALRCGLDATVWGGSTCYELTGRIYTDADARAGKPLPFDHARAHKLYKSLFGEVEDLIKGKHLLVVPSGPLQQLPFQVLVSKPPARAGPTKVRWLARDHAVTVLPAVSSLTALRRVAKASAATRPMIGFGNPLLDGRQSDPKDGALHKEWAALARAHTGCATSSASTTTTLRASRRSPAPLAQQAGLVELAQVRMQTPLPETADELCAVARDLGADAGEVHLGARATETAIKVMSGSPDRTLAQYRILHFATHGALAGQLSSAKEPGLILTPPGMATEEDDGYLSASEIASLKLDADWVILSACNTASSGEAGAEALSGLARAFFYAGARALLVSHWEVDSNATVKLITSAVREITRDRKVGRAEALRRAMLALIDKGQPHEAHPAYWAPFVVVGEGAAAR